MLHLAKNIKTIRELNNKTQVEFAEIFGVKNKKGEYSSDKIYTYETGKAEPPEFLIQEIANYAGVSVSDLKNTALKKSDFSFKEEAPNQLQDSGDNISYGSSPTITQSTGVPEAEVIKLLKDHYNELKMHNEELKNNIKVFEANHKSLDAHYNKLEKFHEDLLMKQKEAIENIQLSLEKSYSNQMIVMRQGDVLMEYIVYHQNKKDEQKTRDEMNRLRVEIASVLKKEDGTGS